jgi:hypothetical protein
VNWSVAPFATLGFTGVTAIDVSAAAVTVSVVAPLTEPDVAVIVEDPIASVEARPDASIVATTTFDDVQATEPVMLAVLPSEYVPVAVNCSASPLATLGLAGVTAIDVTTAGVTVNVVVPVTDPDVAVTIDEPVASAAARPPPVIVATDTLAEDQLTDEVRLAVEPSV